jgi:predicted flap endonuclease-1-like 5' DNA nuclease
MSQTSDVSNSDLPNIGRPATRALVGAGITQLQQLTAWSEADLVKLHGVGSKAVRILREALRERGLTFAETTAPDQ